MDSILIILLIACLIGSAFFSGIEIALAKVNKQRLARAAEKNEKGAKLALSFVENYNDTITTILIGNNLVNIAASSMASILFAQIYPVNSELIATIVVTLAILTFGEVLPKSIASSYSFKVSKALSIPLKFFHVIFSPITKIVKKMLNGFVTLLSKSKENVVTDEEELIEMVDTLEEQGLINEETQELITNAIIKM